MSTKCIVVVNNKGGVGKTTCVAALGDVLARKLNKKVLLIDADPQGNLSKRFGYDINQNIVNSLDVYLENELDVAGQSAEHMPIKLFCNPGKQYFPKKDRTDYKNLSIICSSSRLEKTYSSFRADPENADDIIRDMISELRDSSDYDYIIVDTQPVLGYVLQQFLLGADYIMVPVTFNSDAFDGANAIGMTYNKIKKKKAKYAKDNDLKFLGAFFNMVRHNTKIAKDFKEHMDDYWKNNPHLITTIPLSQSVNNAEVNKAAVTAYDPSSPASVAFVNLAKEVVAKIEEES